MNSAWTYKNTFREKKTHILISVLIALFFLGIGSIGVEEGMLYEEEVEETETALMEAEIARAAEREAIAHARIPYTQYFKENAPVANCDWQLLAAIAYHESRFNPTAGNPSGARGLMQIMPKVAVRYGLNDSTILEPEDNIRVGAQIFRNLQHMFRFIPNQEDRWKFALASYNAGAAHILDARRLTEQNGGNPTLWEDCSYWLEQLQYEEVYTDSVVQYGRFASASATVGYVGATWNTYRRYLNR